MPKVARTEKWCPKCQRMLPAAEFYQVPKAPSGLSAYCMECTKGYNRARGRDSRRELRRVREHVRQESLARAEGTTTQ